MRIELRRNRAKQQGENCFSLDRKLASYLAASASIGAVLASDAKAIVVSNSTPQTIGINGAVNIDFNSDTQTDFQIDHDRVDLGGGNVVDYLQIDKNDVNGASPGENLFVTDWPTPFPVNGTVANDNLNMSYLVQNPGSASSVEYPSALLAGAEIGPTSNFDFQEGDAVQGSTKTGRFNRLIDEDHGQADMALNGKTADQIFTPNNTPQFVGVENQVRYLGVKMELNDAGSINYGWIGIKITNEADATGEVVGWGYQTDPDVAILAGDLAPGTPGDYNGNGNVDAADYVLWRNGGPLQNEGETTGSTTPEDYTFWRSHFGNSSGAGAAFGASSAVPEPTSLLLGLITAACLLGTFVFRRVRGR